jgi:GNAT superfamily N-acetyltransferase
MRIPEKRKDLGANPVRIRKATEADVAFIFSSWLKSMRNSGYSYGVPNVTFYAEHHKVLERLLKSCEVYVACDEANVADIYGYICAERVDGFFVMHFAYVKHTYRRLGIGTMLLNAFQHDASTAALYTHMTKIGRLLEAKYNLVYNPYIALTPDYRKEIATQPKRKDLEALDIEELNEERKSD